MNRTGESAPVRGALADLAPRVGDDLESPEIDPLRVGGATVEALDAVVTWTGNHR